MLKELESARAEKKKKQVLHKALKDVVALLVKGSAYLKKTGI